MNGSNFTVAVYSNTDKTEFGFVVLEPAQDGNLEQAVVEDSGLQYETHEDALFVGKGSVKMHEYQVWKAEQEKTPEYQEWIAGKALHGHDGG